MGRETYYDGIYNSIGNLHKVLPIESGGTGGHDIASSAESLDYFIEDDRDQAGGLVTLDSEGYIDIQLLKTGGEGVLLADVYGRISSRYFETDGISDATITGPATLASGETGTYLITNHDSFLDYKITTSNGTIVKTGNTFTYRARTHLEPGGFTINGRWISVDIGAITLTGPTEIYAGMSEEYTIAPYLASATYDVSTTNGTVTRIGDTITYTPATVGLGNITVNGLNLMVIVESLNIKGPDSIYVTEVGTYYVEPYRATATYVVTCDNGTAVMANDKITYTPVNVCEGGFTINGKKFNIEIKQEIVNKPSITLPVNGETNTQPTTSYASTAFAYIGGTQTHASSTWELSKSATFATKEASVTNSSTHKVTWSTSIGYLTSNTKYYVRVKHKNHRGTESAWSDTVSFTVMKYGINKPSITYPLNNATDVGSKSGFTSSAFSVDGTIPLTHHQSDWELASDAAFTTIVASALNSTSNKTSWTPVLTLTVGNTYYLRLKYKDTVIGVQSPWSDTCKFTVVADGVAKPVITAPVSGSLNLDTSVTLTGSAFAYIGNIQTHSEVDWEISTVSNFTSVAIGYEGTANKTSWSASGLVSNTKYYARLRHISNTGAISPWSDIINFTTKVMSITNTPVIGDPIANATGVSKTPTITSTPFAYTGDPQTHVGSAWEISTSSAFTTTVASYTGSSNKTSWSPTGLNNSTTYYVRVKHEGSLGGWSAWSPAIKFTIIGAAITLTPMINSPLNGTTGVSLTPNIQSSAFAYSGEPQTHVGSAWEISTSSGFSSITASYTGSSNKESWIPPALSNSTLYYVRVKHEGSIAGWSGWSPPVSFTTIAAPIENGVNQPIVTNPMYGQTEVSVTPTFSSSAFSYSGSAQTHSSSEWKLTTETGTPVASISGASYKTSWSPSVTLTGGQYYLVSVRHQSNLGIWSDWSAENLFQVINSTIGWIAQNVISSGKFNASVNGSGVVYNLSTENGDLVITGIDSSASIVLAKKLNFTSQTGTDIAISGSSLFVSSYDGSSGHICKISTSGSMTWGNKISIGAGFSNCTFRSVDVDGSGNVYVCGEALGDNGSYNLLVAKFTSGGSLSWVKTLDPIINGNVHGDFRAYKIAVNSSNVFISGSVYTGDPNWIEASLFKFDTSGNYITNYTFGNTDLDMDLLWNIDFDGSGNLIALAHLNSQQMYILKISSSGSIVTCRKISTSLSSSYSLTHFCLDASNNIYALGNATDGSFVVRLTSSFTVSWAKLLNGPGKAYYDGATHIDIAVTNGCVYVTHSGTNGPNSVWQLPDSATSSITSGASVTGVGFSFWSWSDAPVTSSSASYSPYTAELIVVDQISNFSTSSSTPSITNYTSSPSIGNY